MSTRFVFPELFQASGAPIVSEGKPRLSLRWLINQSIGLPKALFHVWQFSGTVAHKKTGHRLERSENDKILSWTRGELAVSVKVTLSINSGTTTLQAYTAALGAGHIVAERKVNGPVNTFSITLTGNAILSIKVTGSASIHDVSIIKMSEFVNHPGWNLIETVGLPVSRPLFTTGGYPLDQQGKVGEQTDPRKAAIKRVIEGTPDTGWALTTDLGQSIPPFQAPDAETLVVKELNPLLEGINKVFVSSSDPSDQAEQTVKIITSAPRSVHGVDASPHWQSEAKDSKFRPLGSILVAAGSDPFAALALGFGTTIEIKNQFMLSASSSTQARNGIFMVTVEHSVKTQLGESPPVDISIEGELAALYLGTNPNLPPPPAGLTAKSKLPAGASGAASLQPQLDPPGSIDGPWLQTVQLEWNLPLIQMASEPRPSAYVVAKGIPGASMDINNENRLSGGWVVVAPALSKDQDSRTSMRYIDSGVPEAFPGENENLVYSVIAQDLFGRWSNWLSAGYHIIGVDPPLPALRKVDILPDAVIGASINGEVAVEFTWDWTHRRLGKITLRLMTHLPSDSSPSVPGSIFSVGGVVTTDVVFDFTSATPDSPPPGIELISEESQGNLRTYKVLIPGFSLAFSSFPTIRVTAKAMATDRIGPTGRDSAWTSSVYSDVHSPIPPPPPSVPAGMQWASIPDPRGISRTELSWSGTAPMFAVYSADETSIRRELNMPSADLEQAAIDRLIELRAADFSDARRAFQRIVDRLPSNNYRLALPKGTKMIHFYALAPISRTGVEGPLPESSNNYIAAASPSIQTPEQAMIIARENMGQIQLTIRLTETRVETGKIEIYRSNKKGQEASMESMGPPIATMDDSLSVRTGDLVEWGFSEFITDTPWMPINYRVIAYGKTRTDRGIYGGKSIPSRPVEVVPESLIPPEISPKLPQRIIAFPNHILISFTSDAPLVRTMLGSHEFVVQIIPLDGEIITLRKKADDLPLYSVRPLPTEEDSIFRFDSVDPKNGHTMVWVRADTSLVIAEVIDPSGNRSQVKFELTLP
jgi:hypothetical protein